MVGDAFGVVAPGAIAIVGWDATSCCCDGGCACGTGRVALAGLNDQSSLGDVDPGGAAWLAAMRRGDYAAAWAISDAVLAARAPAERDDPRLPYHLRWVWDGRPFRGRHVLVRCYHGLGDTLQFARFLPLLRAQVASLRVEMQPELLPMLAAVAGPDELLPFRAAAPLPPSECDIEIMELGHALRISLDDAARCRVALPRYQGTNGERANGPASALCRPLGRRARLGLCWRAGDWDDARSVPLPALAACCTVAPLDLVCLQRGPAVAEAHLPGAPRFTNPDDRSMAIAGTAALIAGLDLVITVDTMVAHLAGTLGCPTWLLLKRDADWRWMDGRADTPWYPSIRLFRQRLAGDWGEPLAQIAEALRALAPAAAD